MRDGINVERGAFGITPDISADLTNVLKHNKPKINNNVEFDNDGPTLDESTFNPVVTEETEMIVEVDTDEVINWIFRVLERNPQLIYTMRDSRNLYSTLMKIQDEIQKQFGVSIDLLSNFNNKNTIAVAIKLIAKGFLSSFKLAKTIQNPTKIIFLKDINNVNVIPNFFGQGLHKYRNKLAITTFDERVINTASNLLGNYKSLDDIVKQCDDIVIYKEKKPERLPTSAIRVMTKKDLTEAVLNNDLTIGDLKRAGIAQNIIRSIQALV